MKSIYSIALAASLLSSASAEILVRYDTAGLLSDATSVSNSAGTVTNLTTGDLTASGSLSDNKAPNSFAPWGWTQSTAADALANGEFLSFTVSAGSEYQLNLDTLDLGFFVQLDPGNTPDWAIYSSADNFSSPIGNGSDLTGGVYHVVNVDVSSSAFDAIQGDLEFRIVMADTKNEWFWAGVSTDNLSGIWPKPAAVELTGTIEDKVDPIEPELIVPATLVDSAEVYQLVIQSTNGIPDTLYPISANNLVLEDWASVPHAATPFGPFVITNLTYSTMMDGNYSIYVEMDEVTEREFFGIEYLY